MFVPKQDFEEAAREAFLGGVMGESISTAMKKRKLSPENEASYRKIFFGARAKYGDLVGIAKRLGQKGETAETDIMELLTSIDPARRDDFLQLVKITTEPKHRSDYLGLPKLGTQLRRGGQHVAERTARFITEFTPPGMGADVWADDVRFLQRVR